MKKFFILTVALTALTITTSCTEEDNSLFPNPTYNPQPSKPESIYNYQELESVFIKLDSINGEYPVSRSSETNVISFNS